VSLGVQEIAFQDIRDNINGRKLGFAGAGRIGVGVVPREGTVVIVSNYFVHLDVTYHQMDAARSGD
jgi:hypothetical protein